MPTRRRRTPRPARRIPVRSGCRSLQLRAEAFNVFNQKNYRSIETSVTNANFGAVTEYEAQRIMQFGMKVTF